MCFEASTMASAERSLQTSSSFRADAMQFLISPREIKSFDYKYETREEMEMTETTMGLNKDSNLELVDYDSLPEFLKHNEFIINYYRSEWPLKETILSIFSIHNETLNVWTHLIGFFIFLMLAGYAASIFPLPANGINSNPFMAQLRTGNSSNTFNPFFMTTYQTPNLNTSQTSSITRWPFYIYLAGAMFCLLMSSACHLLSCHCSRTSYIMLRLDFAGISGLIVSSFYPIVYYTFACHPFFRNVYLCSITIFGLATVIISLMPVFDSPQFRPVRAVLFACMGASGIVPIAHKMLVYGHQPEAVLTTEYEMVMLMFYGLGVVVYATRVPERWLPGKFDLAGHSHQLFHVLVVAGAYTHYLASVLYLAWRESEGC